MKPVTLATLFNLAEAELIRARLEAAGFHPFIANESAAGWFGGTSAAARIRVEVPEDEADDARELLESSGE
jgi:hypothetical protein